ncbi:ABC transporter permease [Lysobacter silvisoli]|uniref:Transport permease protein n=1 Tax=Lysobacter silvisoli TaxID=2293254 RepID=A0A371JZM1_9GAMM|nr:ABC transporter permease [Lysobacter silvisoli]RDZ27125.1 ABC transporter permease [Lysobacter silvisoli]
MNPHLRHPSGLVSMFGSLRRNWQLIAQMTKRDVISRYRGSLIGLAWSFFNPLLMLAIYTFVFSTIFKARWGVGHEDTRAGFAAILFVGVIVHGLLAECIIKAPSLILSNVSYVKRVVFPLEVLPWVAIGSALFHALVSFIVLMVAQLALGHAIPWTAVFFPVVVLPLVFVAMGFGWILAATSVYVRDIAMITGLFTTALMFLAPVFYPLSALPQHVRPYILLNPLTFIIEQSRAVLIAGQLPDWLGLAVYAALAVVFAWAGYWWFQRSRNGFADVV